MSESSVRLSCVVVGIVALLTVWPLLAGMSVRAAGGIVVTVGLLCGFLVSRFGARRFSALLRLWLGVLLGGVGHWAAHALRFPDDPYSYGFNFTLALAVVLSVVVLLALGYLVGVFCSYCLQRFSAP